MEKDNKYDRKDTLESQVIKEIHIYTNHILYIDSVRVMIPIDSIAYFQFYRGQNKAVLPVLLGGTGLLLIILIITSISFSGMTWHI